MESIRTFISFETPEAVRRRMVEVQSELRQAGADVRWEPEHKLHATVKFLGNVAEAAMPAVLGSIESAVKGCAPFQVTYGTVGAFPAIRRPRVIWIGCENRDGTLETLKRNLDEALLVHGFTAEARAFHPHVTLGRLKSPSGVNDPAGLVNLTTVLEKITFQQESALITRIDVMRSRLRAAGSEYSIIRSLTLQKHSG